MANKPRPKKPTVKKPSTKVYLVNLLAVLANGSVVHLDMTKVVLTDKLTGKPLFTEKE